MRDKAGHEYDEVDMDALRRAMAIAMASTDGRKEQLVSKLRSEPWIEAATLAAYGCQRRALKLKLWQSPPCTGTEDDAEASALCDRLLAAGLSQWEPDPMTALAKFEAKLKGE